MKKIIIESEILPLKFNLGILYVWTGVIMHGGLNGPSFIAIALGLI